MNVSCRRWHSIAGQLLLLRSGALDPLTIIFSFILNTEEHHSLPFAFSGCPNTPLACWRLMFQAWPCWAADYRRIDGSEKPGLVTEMGCLPQSAPELGGMVLLSAPSEERTPDHNSSSFSPAPELSCPQGPQWTRWDQNRVREGSENCSVCQVEKLCFNMSE